MKKLCYVATIPAAVVGETGWVVPSRDPHALAAAIGQAMAARADAPMWEARQQACRARIEQHYGIEAMVGRYRAVWAEAMSVARGASCAA